MHKWLIHIITPHFDNFLLIFGGLSFEWCNNNNSLFTIIQTKNPVLFCLHFNVSKKMVVKKTLDMWLCIYVVRQTGLVFNKTIMSANDLSSIKQNNLDWEMRGFNMLIIPLVTKSSSFKIKFSSKTFHSNFNFSVSKVQKMFPAFLNVCLNICFIYVCTLEQALKTKIQPWWRDH